jgi:hypothetical protein
VTPVTPFFFFFILRSTIHLQPDRFEEAVPPASTQRLSVYYSFRQKSVSTLSMRYKLSRVGFVLMVPLVILAVSFHSWVQLRRSRVCDPCNTLFFFILRNQVVVLCLR